MNGAGPHIAFDLVALGRRRKDSQPLPSRTTRGVPHLLQSRRRNTAKRPAKRLSGPSRDANVGLGASPEACYGFTQRTQLVAERFAKWLMRTSSPQRCRDPLQMTVDAIKATGYELHRMQLAVRMIAGRRRPP
jgi:hypothetical protein